MMLVSQKNILYLSNEDKQIVDLLCFHSARLYNACCYNIRQYYFNNNTYLPFKEQYHEIKDNDNFKLLINDSAQQTLRIVDKSYRSFFSLLNLKAKGKYSENPSIPRYLDKNSKWSVFVAGRSCRVKNNNIYVGLSKLFREKYDVAKHDIVLPLPKNVVGKIHQLQIRPICNGKSYEMIIVYEREATLHNLDKNNCLSIDCGLDNLFTCYDKRNNKSFIIDGKRLKSVNQFFNKQKARLQSIYDKQRIKLSDSKRFMKLSLKRTNVINEYFNLVVKHIADYCIENNIGTLVMGDFKGIKQDINNGSVNNQNFVSIPFFKLKSKLESKCVALGIQYVLQEESYTSKCSCLDLEDICKKGKYCGRRIKRGLYKSSDGRLINADLNGAVNILRKYYKSKSKNDLSFDDVRALSMCQPIRIHF